MRLKQNISVLVRLLIAVLIVSLMVSCNLIYDDCSGCDPLTEPVDIGFTISTGMFSFPETKAPVYGNEPGQAYENYIGIESGDFMFLFFDKNGKYLQTFRPDPEDIIPIGGTGTSPNPDPTGDPMPVNRVYYISGKLNQAYTDFTMVALLNYGGVNGRYPIGEDVAAGGETPDLIVGTTTLDDLISNNAAGGWGIFNYNPTTIPYAPSQATPMPMYGVRTFENVQFRDRMLTDLGDINVLRAYAKIRVRLVGDMATLCDIEGVTLNKYPTVAYKAPDIKQTTPRGVTIATEKYCAPTQVSTGSIPFRKITDDIFEIYVPAYDNINASADKKASITVRLANGQTYENAIQFAYYDDDGQLPASVTYFNILRNYIIDYRITGVRGANLTLQLEANPWIVKQTTFQYTDVVSFPEQGFPTFDDETINTIDYSDMNNGNVYVIMKQDNTVAELNFTIMTPVGSTWKAALLRKHGVSGAFSFVDSGGNVIVDPSGPVGTPATLYIKKNFPQPADENNEYVLRLMIEFPPPSSQTFKINYLELHGSFGTAKEYTIVQPAS
ncbi:MAG: hypothetical protein GX798_05740 [Bacteroidales bacterium]|nr:hypothetical protein [Bacteroidales bacterium]